MAATSLFLAALAAGVAHGQPQPEKKPPQVSERQAERISERERMIACDRQAREAKLPTAKRHEFIRDCIKSDHAAAGSGAHK
jgi:hypothetical protein